MVGDSGRILLVDGKSGRQIERIGRSWRESVREHRGRTRDKLDMSRWEGRRRKRDRIGYSGEGVRKQAADGNVGRVVVHAANSGREADGSGPSGTFPSAGNENCPRGD
jgi:hypothetical protein